MRESKAQVQPEESRAQRQARVKLEQEEDRLGQESLAGCERDKAGAVLEQHPNLCRPAPCPGHPGHAGETPWDKGRGGSSKFYFCFRMSYNHETLTGGHITPSLLLPVRGSSSYVQKWIVNSLKPHAYDLHGNSSPNLLLSLEKEFRHLSASGGGHN